MVKILLESAVICLVVIGLIELIKMLAITFTDNNTDCRCDMVVPVYAHDENIEMLLRSLISIIEWDDKQKIKRLICLDYGMDSETLSICSKVREKYSYIHILTPEEYGKSMEQAVDTDRQSSKCTLD